MKHLFHLIIVALLTLWCVAATAEESPFKVKQLTDQLYLLSTDQGSYTTNTIAFVGDDGVLLVDTQSEEFAGELKKIVDEFGKGTPKYIINTHRHTEHIGGNEIFGDSPVVIAHDLVPARLRSDSYIWAEFGENTFPDITVADSLTLFFNGERIRLIAIPGSHDDNEIIVHFTSSKIVHLSSLVNGFNFPSIDSKGSALVFPEAVARAMEILPQDVTIVSGHNGTGTWQQLQPYHTMLVETIEAVRVGLAAGKDLAALQEEKTLEKWSEYAGSYVSVNGWTEYLVDAIENPENNLKTVYEPLYYEWKDNGAVAALELYSSLKANQAEEYRFDEFNLMVIGSIMVEKEFYKDAVGFFEASLEENPESKYNYYTNYELARAHKGAGDNKAAINCCKKSIELKPDFNAAATLLAELEE